MAKVEGWQHNLLWIVIILAVATIVMGVIFSFLRDIGPGLRTWINVGFALGISCYVGFIALVIICPDKKMGQIPNRITIVIALICYSLCLLASFLSPRPEFNFNLFLIEGVLVGAITMGIIFGIAQVIHWSIKGNWM